jgi:DNA modification methylase
MLKDVIVLPKSPMKTSILSKNRLLQGDALTELQKLPDAIAQAVIADPPYFNVLENEAWDTQWPTADDYLAWCEAWVAKPCASCAMTASPSSSAS